MSPQQAAAVARLEHLTKRIQKPNSLVRIRGKVSAVKGSHIATRGITSFVTVGDLVGVDAGHRQVLAEVLSLHEDSADIQLLDSTANIKIDSAVEVVGPFSLFPADQWRGRVINALAETPTGEILAVGTVEYTNTSDPSASIDRTNALILKLDSAGALLNAAANRTPLRSLAPRA